MKTFAHEALDLVHGPRQRDYGHPWHDFSKTASIWSIILGTPVTPEQVALCMVAVKLSREVNRPKDDNIIDAHGYLLTYEMVKQFRQDMEDEQWDKYAENLMVRAEVTE